ncbi:unnamed protein product [Mesocestoides corti]|uniref:Major facilitator superfamily (MFS) profile domain-containing protein n=2 Tax=Mesocestoides corti TaxID=53468 RepID=A0A0R3UA40_MESCO|nr:unnamed protein product [Mesocestoides corti]
MKQYMFQKRLPDLVILIFSIYKITETLLQTSTRLQIYHVICFFVTKTISSDLNSTCYSFGANNATDWELDRPIQRKAAPFIIGYRCLLNIPAMFVCLILGNWSDQHGRKGPMILPIMGACLACCLFGASLAPGYPPIPFQVVCLLLGALIYGICGKSNALGMGAHSYITDCSTEEERTTRIGRLMGTNFVGLCVGSMLVSVFYYFSSYGWALFFVTVVNSGILILLVVVVKESVAVTPSDMAETDYGSTMTLTQETKGQCEEKGGCLQTIRTSSKQSLEYVTKTRPNGRHTYLRILLGAVLFNQVTKAGEQDSLMLFFVRQEIGWSDGIYGAYLATYYASMAFNLIVIFPLIDHVFKPSDISLILFGLAMKSVRLIGTALTTNTPLIFIYAVLGSSAGYIISAIRSLITKLASSGEIGTSFALMSVLETFANLFGSVLFTSLYTATVPIFPGTIFIIDAFLHIGMFSVMCWVGWKLSKLPTPE